MAGLQSRVRTRESIDHEKREQLFADGAKNARIQYCGDLPKQCGLIAEMVGLRSRLSGELATLRSIRSALLQDGKVGLDAGLLGSSNQAPPESLAHVLEDCAKLLVEFSDVSGEIYERL